MSNGKVPNRNNWIIHEGEVVDNRLHLDSMVKMYIAYMLDRTLQIFDYKNLPDGITNKDMEKYTQLNGYQFWMYHNNRYYILKASIKEGITWNDEAEEVLIVNPALDNLKTVYRLHEDGVLFKNDSYYVGLAPMLESNAIQLASVDISLMFASFNSRLKTILTSDDDTTTDSINKMLTDIWNGETPVAITTDELYKNSINGIKYAETQTNDIKDLIELKQYIKANWYIDLGINANYNMKRESINENEIKVNDDALLPLIDDMLNCRIEAIDEINNKYGLNITVDLSSSWKKLREEIMIKKETGNGEKLVEEGDEDVSKD